MDADHQKQTTEPVNEPPVDVSAVRRTHTTSTYRHRGVNVTEHRLEVPLDYDKPDGRTITVFARELSTGPTDPCDEKPALIFMQGGPGGRAPRPGNFMDGWIGRALTTHRVILMDERGTGQSTRLDALTLSEFDTTQDQVDYIKNFRADSIVKDAESLRERINDGKPWASLGQSYGGFINLTYMSHHPEGLAQVYFTGGLPGLVSIDDIYRRTYEATALRNQAYFERFPDDEKTLRAIINHLDNHEETLPTGERLTSRRFRMIGLMLGTTTGFDQLHYFFEGPFTLVRGETRLNTQFLDMVHRQVSMGDSPMYALLHETIYAGTTNALAGTATNWAAARLLDEVGHGIDEGFAPNPDPDDRETPIYLTGEHIYPWLFDEDPALTPLKDVAHALAQETNWPTLYDETALSENELPAAAAVYAEDMFVPLDLSLVTARLAHVDPWITNEYQHDGLRVAGADVLSKLIELATH
ncbi:MAG: alpha/beta fold hydrolase [Actinomycetaceae bacterium]|nr:alpha/beta fold hydrolase [Actinomycetaceae bacterium]